MAKRIPPPFFQNLSRREQQILSSVNARRSATTHDVLEDISEDASYSSIRKIMEIMVAKGLLSYRREGLRYVYEPGNAISQAQTSSLTQLIRSLFDNSPVKAVATLLASEDLRVSASDLKRMQKLIAQKTAENAKAGK